MKHVGLTRKCSDAAFKSLNIDNVIQMLEKSIQYEDNRVEEGCWRFVESNFVK